MISFKAKKICPATAKERLKNRHYRDNESMSFVKLSNTTRDKKTLRDLADYWSYEANFSRAIYSDYFDEPSKNKSIYVLSTQTTGFKKLDPKKILGIAEVIKNNKSYKLRYLQTRPDCMSDKKARPYKKIGDAILSHIITITGGARIYLEALDEAVDFYKRFGFKVIQDDVANPVMLLIKNCVKK